MNAGVSVRELMNREYVGVSESDDLVETVELLLRENAEIAVVQRGSDCVGVLTERDVLATLVEGPPPGEATVGDAMTESVPTVGPEESVEAAATELSSRSVRRLVVTDGGEPLGVLTERDVLASRTYGAEPGTATADTAPGTVGDETPGTVGNGPAAREMEAGTDQFEDQSICEGCGALASDLAAFNGQLLCAECRDI
jgi:CBS domain-containing protein